MNDVQKDEHIAEFKKRNTEGNHLSLHVLADWVQTNLKSQDSPYISTISEILKKEYVEKW